MREIDKISKVEKCAYMEKLTVKDTKKSNYQEIINEISLKATQFYHEQPKSIITSRKSLYFD